MDYLANSLATKPPKIKTTAYYTPEVYALLKASKGTMTCEVNTTFLLLGAQTRQLPGVGPRPLNEFATHLGFDATLPPEYRYTAREREQLRNEARKEVGFNPTTREDTERAIEEWWQEGAAFFVEGFSTYLADEHFLVEELIALEDHKTENFYSLFSEVLAESTPYGIDQEQTPWKFYAKPLPVKDLPKQSSKLAELVALANLYCPEVLAGVASRAEGRTLEALERELELLVGINRPKTPEAGKRRFWRNSS